MHQTQQESTDDENEDQFKFDDEFDILTKLFANLKRILADKDLHKKITLTCALMDIKGLTRQLRQDHNLKKIAVLKKQTQWN